MLTSNKYLIATGPYSQTENRKPLGSYFSTVFLLLLAIISHGLSAEEMPFVESKELSPSGDTVWSYSVRPGDTLWDLCEKYIRIKQCASKLTSYNNVKNPKYLPPGKVILIPSLWLQQQPAKAVVVSISGSAYVSTSATDNRIALQEKMELGIGQAIDTDKDSYVILEFADKSRLYIFAESRVVLDKLSAHGESGAVDTTIKLNRGAVNTKVIPFGTKDSRFRISTPAAVAAVRGTEFRVEVLDEGERMKNEVIQELVSLQASGQSEDVRGGFGTFTKKGEKPQPPRKLLTAPEMHQSNLVSEKSYFSLSWNAIAGAKDYRVQAYRGDSLLWQRHTAESKVEMSDLMDARYRFFVSAIDDIGLEGLYTATDVQVKIPILIPTNTSLSIPSLKSALLYSWDEMPEVSHYSVEVNRTHEGQETIEVITTKDQQVSIDKQGADKLSIRVKAHYVNKKESDYSVPQEWSKPKSDHNPYLGFGVVIGILFFML